MRTATAITAVFLTAILAGTAAAQALDEGEQLRLGRAAMAAHDPAAAIPHFERVETREGRELLAAALMTESRSASDQYVERAFDAAMLARGEARPRSELAAALRPGEMVIVFLVGEVSAWAWAFDAQGFAGYPLPSPSEIATAATRARAYLGSGDREGAARIAEDLLPALLGPALDRLATLKRLILAVDDPLRGLPVGALPAGEKQSPLAQQVAVSIADDGALLDAIRMDAAPVAQESLWQSRAVVIAAVAVLITALMVLLRRSKTR